MTNAVVVIGLVVLGIVLPNNVMEFGETVLKTV